jgi:hypothetical protein
VLSEFETTQALSVKPRLDPRRLSKAFDALTQQHPMLRTAFPEEENGEPGRLVSDVHPTGLETYDAENLSESEFRRLIAERAAEVSDLENGPVFRLLVFHRPDDTDVVLLKIQEMAGDGWSLLMIVQELLARYTGISAADLFEAVGSAKTYDDFLAWQHRLVQSSKGQESLAFWRERFSRRPPRLRLPQDRPRKPQSPRTGGEHRFRLGGGIGTEVARVAKAQGVTEFGVTLAAFGALMAGYSGARDILVNAFAANRAQRDFEGVVGFVANFIAYRLSVDPEASFAKLCRATQEEVQAVLHNQSVPTQEVIAELAEDDEVYRDVRARADTQTALFQLGFSMRHPGNVGTDAFDEFINDASRETPLDFGGVHIRRFPVDRHSAIYDLGFYVQQSKGTIYAEARYNADIYDAATVKRIVKDYENLLRKAVAKPEGKVRTLFRGLKAPVEPAEVE